jgi:hypothetical protein
MTSTAYDDQFVTMNTSQGYVSSGVGGITTIIVGGGGGGAGTTYTGYGAVPPIGGASGSFVLPSGTIGISSGGTGYASSTSMSTSILSIRAEGDGDAMIKTNKNIINLDELAAVIETVKERLLILAPNFELMEQYPTLKDAYDQYKLIEAMLKEENTKK